MRTAVRRQLRRPVVHSRHQQWQVSDPFSEGSVGKRLRRDQRRQALRGTPRHRSRRRQLAPRSAVPIPLGPDRRPGAPRDRGQRAGTGLVGPDKAREVRVRWMLGPPRVHRPGDLRHLWNRRCSVG